MHQLFGKWTGTDCGKRTEADYGTQEMWYQFYAGGHVCEYLVFYVYIRIDALAPYASTCFADSCYRGTFL